MGGREAPAGPVGPDPSGDFLICAYTISPDLRGVLMIAPEHFLCFFFFFFEGGGDPGSYACKAGAVVTEPDSQPGKACLGGSFSSGCPQALRGPAHPHPHLG
jgi:hypothetical protein